jgi:quercetin dioxygenase-like cupin family protein
VVSISTERPSPETTRRLTLTHHPDGVAADGAGTTVVYDIEADEAYFGRAVVGGQALMWELHNGAPSQSALLSAEVALGPGEWVVRCDRIDFPPGGIAHLHTHPGPGIRCQLFGELTVETEGRSGTYGPLGSWFEAGPDPVYAVASGTEDSAFARVMILPTEWEGKRTINYVHEADAAKPKRQRATVFFDRRIEL